MRPEHRRRPIQCRERVAIAVLVDQADRLAVSRVAGRQANIRVAGRSILAVVGLAGQHLFDLP